jgi:hypothetical protein
MASKKRAIQTATERLPNCDLRFQAVGSDTRLLKNQVVPVGSAPLSDPADLTSGHSIHHRLDVFRRRTHRHECQEAGQAVNQANPQIHGDKDVEEFAGMVPRNPCPINLGCKRRKESCDCRHPAVSDVPSKDSGDRVGHRYRYIQEQVCHQKWNVESRTGPHSKSAHGSTAQL